MNTRDINTLGQQKQMNHKIGCKQINQYVNVIEYTYHGRWAYVERAFGTRKARATITAKSRIQ